MHQILNDDFINTGVKCHSDSLKRFEGKRNLVGGSLQNGARGVDTIYSLKSACYVLFSVINVSRVSAH